LSKLIARSTELTVDNKIHISGWLRRRGHAGLFFATWWTVTRPRGGVGRRFLFPPKSIPVASNVSKQFGVHYEQEKIGTGDLAYA
jgi:hypothetical protein